MRRLALVAALLTVAGTCASAAPAAPPIAGVPDVSGMGPGYLGFCKNRSSYQGEWNCYVSNLLRVVLKARDPATKLPQLDTLARQAGGFLEASCHMMMHVVGRNYAVRNHVTLETLQRYLPRSNDPGCSAGFGMGLVMGLGHQLLDDGAKGARAICERGPTRFRQYTCFHSLGHAYMRLYHGYLKLALPACRALATQVADCVQGAFHDYWLGLSGQDGARHTHGEPRTARGLCGRQHGIYVIACWFRYYLTLPPKQTPSSAARIDRLCSGLTGLQREGCIASASVISSPVPAEQFTICSHLAARDVDGCLRGVLSQDLPDVLQPQLQLISRCGSLAGAARSGCYAWFGTTFSVVTNGRFAKTGCPRLASILGRAACLLGAKEMDRPLVTFA